MPRIVIVQQNIDRLTKYGIPQEKIGAYFGECKEVREITISTYQSAISNLDLINNANMIIFDEVHLIPPLKSDDKLTIILNKILTV